MLTRCLTCLTLTALPTAALAVPVPADGSTGECATDADCPDGMTCEVTGGSSCACEPGGNCDCPVVEYHSCVPGPCESDADCGEGMICATFEVPCASARPCSSDGNCEEPPPCEATSESICAPRWVLPCATAADCGEGFTCEPVEICTCSGGGATDPATPDDPPPDSGSGSGSGEAPPSEGAPMPPEGDCTCEPSGDNACIAVEIDCEDASACPSGWTCEHYGWGAVDCTEPAQPPTPEGEPGSGGSGGSGGSSGESDPADGGCGAPAEPPPPTSGICYPPGGGAFDSGVPRSDDAATPEHASGSATHADGNGEEMTPADPALPGNNTPNESCAGGGTGFTVAGVALLFAALWRRRRVHV